MHFIKTIIGKLSKYIDIVFFLKFIFLMGGLYYFNLFIIGITDTKGRFYSSFITHHLDYISWLRSSILYTSELITKIFGVNSYVADAYTLKAPHGASVILGFTCIGYGVMSFWVAFIVAQNTGWKSKLAWCFSGVVTFWFINCLRIAILLLALQNKWKVNKYVDHHEMFNIITYIVIMMMLYMYYKVTKKEIISTSKKPDFQQRRPKPTLTVSELVN